jgi:hypothetical protein
MKKLKIHLISISIIVIMLIFGLSTSYSVLTNIEIVNKSSKNIIMKISINDRLHLYNENGNHLFEFDEETNTWEYSEELSLNINQTAQFGALRVRGGNNWPGPKEIIISIVIFDEHRELLKKFNSIDNTDELSSFLQNFKRRGTSHNRKFIFTVDDKLLE